MVIEIKQETAHHPPQGVAKSHEMRLILDMGDNEKIDLSKKDKGKEHDDHWRPGIANAPQNASVDLVQAGKESEPTVRSDEKGAIQS